MVTKTKEKPAKKPTLTFIDRQLVPLVEERLCKDALILADRHNLSKVRQLGRTALVENNKAEQVERIRKLGSSRLIAVGGCTVIDIARAVSKDDDKLIVIPTILSTACISVDKAVLNVSGRTSIVRASAPNEVLISIPVLLDTTQPDLEKWTQSGFGDIFGRLGAAIDCAYANGNLTSDALRTMAPDAFDALAWVLDSFRDFDSDALARLAVLSHYASMNVLEGKVKVGGSEHELCYAMVEQQAGYTTSMPTHGQLVATGTLIAAGVFAEITGDRSLYDMLRTAYRKLGLPITFAELRAVGIEKVHLVEGLASLRSEREAKGLLRHFSDKAILLLGRIFSGDCDAGF